MVFEEVFKTEIAQMLFILLDDKIIRHTADFTGEPVSDISPMAVNLTLVFTDKIFNRAGDLFVEWVHYSKDSFWGLLARATNARCNFQGREHGR
ncbi:hypothetical protein D3C77_718650 [compost metagenome]